MTIIIAHIKGPSGGGKTTLGEILNKKYPFIKNIDTDDVMIQDLPSMFPRTYAKYLEKNKLDLFRKKYFNKGLMKAIKPYKYVILVGDSYFNIQDIDTENKYVINIDEDVLIKRRFNRHLQFMANNVDHYFNKAKKKPLCVDLDKWTGERLYWGYTRDRYYAQTKEDGYTKMTQEEIIEKLEDMIDNMELLK